MYNLVTGFQYSVNSIFWQDIFRFLVSMFGELDDIASPYFSRRAKVLETIAKLKFCLLMLDTGCEDLVFKMFKSFFSVVRFAFSPLFLFSVAIFSYCSIFFLFCAYF